MVEPILRGEADLVLGSRLLLPGAALAAGMPRWKFVANRVLTAIENRHHGHRPLGGAHRLSRLLAPAAAHRPVPAQLARLRVRLRAADAGVALRLHDRRGPGALPLLRGRVLGRASRPVPSTALKTLWAGFRLVLHRRGLLPLAQVQALGDQLHDPEAPSRAPTGRSRKRASIRCSAHSCSGASSGRASCEHVARRVRPQRWRAPPRRRRSMSIRSPGRSASTAARSCGSSSAAAKLASHGSPRSSRSARPLRMQDLDAEVGRDHHEALALARHGAMQRRCAGRRPGRQRRRVPEALERAAQRAAARRGVRERASAGSGRRSTTKPTATTSTATASAKRQAAVRVARATAAAAQQQAQPERAGEQRRQRDVDQDVVQRAVDVVAEQRDPVGGDARDRDQRRALALDERAAPARQLDERGRRGQVGGADDEPRRPARDVVGEVAERRRTGTRAGRRGTRPSRAAGRRRRASPRRTARARPRTRAPRRRRGAPARAAARRRRQPRLQRIATTANTNAV